MGAGLQKICKLYGRMEINGKMFVWDYAKDCAVAEREMPLGSERWRASENARMEQIKHMTRGERNTTPSSAAVRPDTTHDGSSP